MITLLEFNNFWVSLATKCSRAVQLSHKNSWGVYELTQTFMDIEKMLNEHYHVRLNSWCSNKLGTHKQNKKKKKKEKRKKKKEKKKKEKEKELN